MCKIIDQGYYWTPEWQEGEREADEDIREGRVIEFSTMREAIEYFKQRGGEIIKKGEEDES